MLIYLQMIETDEDKQRFAEIYMQTHARAEQTAIRLLHNQQDAEDAVQNAYVQVIRHLEKTKEIPCKDLPFWIISIVKNEALMILRKKKRVMLLEDWDGAVEEAEGISDYQSLVRFFASLPETYRAAMEMKYLIGYSSREIARYLDISEDAVNTRLLRGRKLLQSILEKEGYHT